MQSNSHETRVSTIWLGDDGILRIVNKPGVVVSIDDVEENIVWVSGLLSGRKVPALIDVRQTRYIERKARLRLSKLRMLRAEAVVIESAVSTMIGNFFMGINRLSVPSKLFTCEADALAWLNGFLHD